MTFESEYQLHYTIPVTLDQLPLGTPAQIISVSGERSYRRRLLELGLLPGAVVEVLRVAPLGDPLELSVRSTCLSIRAREAAQITVSPTKEGSA